MIYLLAVIILSVSVCADAIILFSSSNIAETIKGDVATARPYLFRRIGIIVQLIVSLAFIFCTVVIMKQLHFLKNTDLEVWNVIMWLMWHCGMETFINGQKIKALPMVTPKTTQLEALCEELDASFLFIQLSDASSIRSHLKACRDLRIPYVLFKDAFAEMDLTKVILPIGFLEEELEKAQFAAAFGRFAAQRR